MLTNWETQDRENEPRAVAPLSNVLKISKVFSRGESPRVWDPFCIRDQETDTPSPGSESLGLLPMYALAFHFPVLGNKF